MVKYRLHNITDYGVEIHDFYSEGSLNNYISIFVDDPYWVECLQTGEILYNGKVISSVDNGKLTFTENVSRETLHETELQWINRNISEKHILEDELFTPFDKAMVIVSFVSVIVVFFILGYSFLSILSILADWLSSFNWWFFNIL